jgi:hypothetical protein
VQPELPDRRWRPGRSPRSAGHGAVELDQSILGGQSKGKQSGLQRQGSGHDRRRTHAAWPHPVPVNGQILFSCGRGRRTDPRVRTRRPPAGREADDCSQPPGRSRGVVQRSVVVTSAMASLVTTTRPFPGLGSVELVGKRTVPGRGRPRSGRWSQHERRRCGRSTVLRQCRRYREREDLEGVSCSVKLGDRRQGDGGTADRGEEQLAPAVCLDDGRPPQRLERVMLQSSTHTAAPCLSSAGLPAHWRTWLPPQRERVACKYDTRASRGPGAVRTVCASAAFMLPGIAKSDLVRRGGERRHVG